MIEENLIERLELYLKENFTDLSDLKFSYYAKSKEGFIENIKSKIDAFIDKFDYTFSNHLLDLIKQKGLTEVEVYKNAHLDRRIFSKLRNNRNYKPGKHTILAVAFAMKLNVDEAEELLNKGGYSLSNFDKRDMIIKFLFENQIYDLFTVNEILEHYGFPPIGD